MQRRGMVPMALLILAALVLGYAFYLGQLRVAFFLIFPIFYGTGPLAALGMLLLFAAMVAWVVSSFRRALSDVRQGGYAGGGYDPYADRGGYRDQEPWTERTRTIHVGAQHQPEEPRRMVRGGGLVMLGPIPIVFGSDRGVVKGLLILGLILTAGLILLAILANRP